ncbi:hypothetical protein Cyast_1624 [Cyanobacterium stanieri PCC 7202]|uniref:Uncharacterized protein n=1 Tax=Cyanobacterium stanieri (strain ATCC 29140 / PCC 7202) TaxID=292563 RepID=K9YMF2_CYASC|nr:hypothetical protein Cyast_1624 [Cyanobacterium stanieri PCC 7202]
MIIDRVQLAGIDAYLRDAEDINLASSPNNMGITKSVQLGMGVDVSGINLLLKADNLLELMSRSNLEDRPMLKITLRKEMFPQFYADPYAHRVHTIGGYDDFHRGLIRNMRAMEVEGQATLVSLNVGECSWQSPIYVFPQPIQLKGAAWELATSRLTPSDGFGYGVTLDMWVQGQDPENDSPTTIEIVSEGSTSPSQPEDLRHQTNLESKEDIIAYRILFKADVQFDSYLTEFQFRQGQNNSLGRPLLRKFHLLESIDSTYTIFSLHELESQCSEFSILEVSPPLQTLTAYLPLSALLVENESIILEINSDYFSICEAHLNAQVIVRPPITDKQYGGSNG